MTGIVGIVDLRGERKFEPHLAAQMLGAIAHRGPDDQGRYDEPGFSLAVCRLAVDDREGGRQPATSHNRRVIAAVDGFIANGPELRAELAGQGVKLQGEGDAELVAELYAIHGRDLLAKIQGQFAIAVFDMHQRTLLLARDRMGIAPLHWARRGETLYFASEIKAILASGEVVAEADPRGIDHIFNVIGMGTRRTAFREIWAIPPAGCMTISLREDGLVGELRQEQYWDLEFPDRGQERRGDDAKIQEEFAELFRQSIRRRLNADVPVVSYLSGGVDSTSVMLTAAQLQGRPLPGFTLRIDEKNLDESPLARGVAQRLGMEPTIVTCNGASIADAYPALVTSAESPVMNSACAALYRLAEEVGRQDFHVALTGEGADDVLAGYPWLKAERLMGALDAGAFRPSDALRRAAAWVGGSRLKWADIKAKEDAFGGSNGFIDLFGLISMTRDRFYSASMREELAGFWALDDVECNRQAMRRWHPLNRGIYLGLKTFLPGLLMNHKGDRAAMRHGVQTRYPFLDDEFVAFLAGIDPRWKLRSTRKDKWLLRQYAAKILPKEIALRPKALFKAPFEESFFRQPPAWAEQLLSDESLARTGYFDAKIVHESRAALDRKQWVPIKRTIMELGLTGVMATQLWHHIYLGGGLCELPTWSPAAGGHRPAESSVRSRVELSSN
jgi:asparagine synthase (glutamine-hydrolysing)